MTVEKSSLCVQGIVVQTQAHLAFVRIAEGCGRCHEKGGCGGVKLTQFLGHSERIFALDNTVQAQVGEKVEVQIAPQDLNFSVTLAYGIPLLSFVLGGLLGNLLAGEGWDIVFSFASLGLAFCIVQRQAQRMKNAARIARRIL